MKVPTSSPNGINILLLATRFTKLALTALCKLPSSLSDSLILSNSVDKPLSCLFILI